jgi:hypothetical protein
MRYLKTFEYYQFNKKTTPEEIQKRLDRIKIVAKNYENAYKFGLDYSSDYGFLRKNNLVGEVKFKKRTIDNRIGAKLYWTPERIGEEAEKYLTRKQFIKNSSGAYRKAVEFDLIDALFPEDDLIDDLFPEDEVISDPSI